MHQHVQTIAHMYTTDAKRDDIECAAINNAQLVEKLKQGCLFSSLLFSFFRDFGLANLKNVCK